LRVDCDVHVAAPQRDALAPYLPSHWEEYLRVLMNYRQPPGVNWTYPVWPAMFAGPDDAPTISDLQRDVLAGVDVAILHCYYGLESLNHPYLAPALARAVNSWLADEWLERDTRLRGSAVVAPQFPDAAVEEIERIGADGRFVEIMLPAWATAGYGTQRFWPILSAAARHGLVVGITYGGLTATPPTPVNWMGSFFEDYGVATLPFASQLASIVYSGVLSEYPDLKLTVSESGWTWLPAFMWRMDAEWRAFQREIPWVAQPPSEYVRRHFRFTTQPTDMPPTAKEFRQVIDQLGSPELLLHASDYPHRYGAGVVELLDVLSDEAAERVLGGCAADWYALDGRATGVPAVE